MRTEQIDPRYVELDSWSAAEMIAAMYDGQVAAAAAVRGALGAIAAAVEDAVPALQRGGRIAYAGAGTSGRIGVQDGAELPPTFNWPADRLVFAMAGGLDALLRSAEQAEDNEAAGAQAMIDAKIGPNDVVIGVAASGTTPFTIGALRARNAKLRRRAAGIVSEIIHCSEPDAVRFLEQADGDVKTAVLIGMGLDCDEATRLLDRHAGNLRSAIKESKAGDG